MTTLTDIELARLEELHELAEALPWNPMDDEKYIEAACNAAPSLVAEVRRLREDNEGLLHVKKAAIMCGRAIENENAALRERVEALEWLREVEEYSLSVDHPYGRTIRYFTDEETQAWHNARVELFRIKKAAREAIK